jgi:hypothetical protein
MNSKASKKWVSIEQMSFRLRDFNSTTRISKEGENNDLLPQNEGMYYVSG